MLTGIVVIAYVAASYQLRHAYAVRLAVPMFAVAYSVAGSFVATVAFVSDASVLSALLESQYALRSPNTL